MRLKTELYAKEQDDTIDKIIQIIGITTENNTITLLITPYITWQDQVIYVENNVSCHFTESVRDPARGLNLERLRRS